VAVRQVGSHVIYEKNGIRYCVPDHGSKEIGTGLATKERLKNKLVKIYDGFSRIYSYFEEGTHWW